MTAISVELPPQLYQHLQHQADRQQTTLAAILQQELVLLAEYSLPLLADLDTYSDEQLIGFLGQHFNPLYQERIDALTQQAKREGITSEEKAQLDNLLELYADYMLLRSKALALLKEQGHELTPYLTRASNFGQTILPGMRMLPRC